ncbi:TPA: fimbrial protein [Haemophilus influenzae]|uniref:fimbrial protein n=1 Tax=Haemophilus influenzae TaxID=727 RepID=UPI001EF9B551|nr:fimbrial protein [Haemophilus influenzae]
MKKALLGSLIFLAFAANAADPNVNPESTSKVTFKGKVLANTCKLETESQNMTVTLPDVGKNALDQKGRVAGPKPFQIKLKECGANSATPAATVVRARFYHIPAAGMSTTIVDATNDFTLTNTKTTNKAQNVNIQLFEKDGSTPIKIVTTGSTETTPTTIYKETINGGNNIILHYVAKYYATGVATAGEVEASTNFEVVYD